MPARPVAGPSRTSTPTPTSLQLDHAPLRLPPSPNATSSLLDDDDDASAGATSASLLPPATGSAPPSPSSHATLRSRRPVSPFPSSTVDPDEPPSSSRAPSPRGRPNLARVDSDVTRPSLRRVTNDALGVAALGTATASSSGALVGSPDADGYVLRRDSKGKGKAVEHGPAARRGVSENGAAAKEREVIVHKVQKTDSYASISLQYGITPQALRSSNRLWPSDPIYLRSTLLIPLDQCNLPSSSFGVERIAREENGDLTVWERNGAAGSASSAGLSGAAARRERDGALVSPQARRVAAASALELGARAAQPALGPPIDLLADDDNEYHSVWSDGGTPSARGSLDVPRAPSSPYAHLARTTSSYFDGRLSGGRPSIEDLGSRGVSPSTAAGSSSFSPVPSSSSRATSPPAAHPPSSFPTTDDDGASPPLAKRTLRVARLPASQLAFFPPSSSASSTTSSPHSPSKPTHAQQQHPRRRPEDESLFFGPLTNSLSASFSSLGLDRYLPASLSSSSSSSRLNGYGGGGGKGRIALPISPALADGAVAGVPPRTKSRWALLDFGVEEDEAAVGMTSARAGRGAGPAGARREDYFALAAGPEPGAVPAHAHAQQGAAAGAGAGAGAAGAGPRRTSANGLGLGLEDAGSWSGRRGGAGAAVRPALNGGGSPRQGHKKARDSNEGLATVAGLQGARADARDLFRLR
ncbi:carbohydrate-binding module family 50 protein [Rhodotorula graminis WP1]|uniref:Carbohydrate-binding module family 50 protein n=1 Tax=Rhodotorula graminis (strain WP1) TaxID=578459 RepID=A0A194SAX9_RHOGW|nr:carbohydrate-binding module family 50 protein [Rhodotorula graminis WP1]KPV77878.1 carbohydrate-binding module family 50 protein [Rhodotorula graminis WP1]